MSIHDKSPSIGSAGAFKEKLKNRCLANRTIYHLFDAICRPTWDSLSQHDGQALFRILSGYVSKNWFYQHAAASFLRYHSTHAPGLSQAERKALESELLAARQAQAEAEFSRELSNNLIAKIAHAVQYAPIQKLQILDTYIAKAIELSGVPEDE